MPDAVAVALERVVAEHAEEAGNSGASLGVEDVLRADDWARSRAREMMGLTGQKESAR